MDIKRALYKIYWSVERIIAPRLKYSQYLYTNVLESHLSPNIKWLDLGCGHQILSLWRSQREKHLVGNCKMLVVGLDYDLHSLKKHKTIVLRVRGDISKLPFKASAFDLVTSNMVVEHLDSPEIQFKEINRILKPGGTFLFHTPNALSYTTIMSRLVPKKLKDKLVYILEGRKEEDVFDTYYRAN